MKKKENNMEIKYDGLPFHAHKTSKKMAELSVCILHLSHNRRMRLMHDEAPCHTSDATHATHRAHRAGVLSWPSRSSFSNIMEHILVKVPYHNK